MSDTRTKNEHFDQQVKIRLQGLCAGGISGAIAKTATAPLDRLKILCQTGAAPGPIAAFKQVYQRDGITGFWKGNSASVIRILPSRGILFMTSDLVKDSMRGFKRYGPNETPPPLSSLQYVCAGSISGCITVVTTYPLDLIRGRMTASLNHDGHQHQFNSILNTFRITLKEEGWKTLYRGMSVSLIGSLPYEGVRFGVYDTLKSRYLTETTPIYYNVAIGAISGLVATVCLYPNDTVRRRLQIQRRGGTGDDYYVSGLDAYRSLYRKHGIRVFYSGLSANLIRAAPSAAMQFGSFEFLKRQFSLENKKNKYQ